MPVIVGMTLFSFILIHLVPGDPIRIMLGGKAPEAVVENIDHQLGLDRPLPEQYVTFVGRAPRGDLGESIVLRRPVSSIVGERIGPSLFLLGYGTLIGIVLAVPLGIASALMAQPAARPRDSAAHARCVRDAAVLARADARAQFSLDLGWFPVSGYGTGFLGHCTHLTLPALTIGLFLASMLVRSLRASLHRDPRHRVHRGRRARAGFGGARRPQARLRNALISTITVLTVNIGFLIGGAVDRSRTSSTSPGSASCSSTRSSRATSRRSRR